VFRLKSKFCERKKELCWRIVLACTHQPCHLRIERSRSDGSAGGRGKHGVLLMSEADGPMQLRVQWEERGVALRAPHPRGARGAERPPWPVDSLGFLPISHCVCTQSDAS
jgi:hypothetical protein